MKVLRSNLLLIVISAILVFLMLFKGSPEVLLRSISFIIIWAIVAIPLNLITGWVGLLSWAQAGAAAIGGYTAALMMMKLGVPWPVGMLGGMVGMAIVGAIIGLPSLRVKGHQFMVLNFAFMIIIVQVITNMDWLTKGADGLWPVPRPWVFGWVPTSSRDFGLFALIFLVAVGLICWRIASSPLGRAFKAVRDEDIAAEAVGKDVVRLKVMSFMLVSALGAVGGSLYAFYVTALDPQVFNVNQSIVIATMIIVGGIGSLIRGSIVGVSLVMVFPIIMSLYVSMPKAIEAPVRGLLYGVLLIVMMMFRPQGILGKRE